MLGFLKSENNIIISKDGKAIYKLAPNDHMCAVAKGKNDYKMWHGSFKIKEKISDKRDVKIKSIHFDGEKISVMSEPISFEITIENESTLKFTPTVSDGYNRMWIEIPATESEAVYGGGENFTEFNLRSKKLNVWVAEHINALQTAKKLARQAIGIKNSMHKQRLSSYETYYAEPTFLSSRKYFFHSETTARAEFDFTNHNRHIIKTDSIAPFYIGFGNDFEEVLGSLTSLISTQPELPDWVYDGSILGIQGGTDTMLEKLDKCLERNTAVCGIWIQDWEGRRVTAVGKQLQWNWEWDRELYPALDEKIKELASRGIRVLGYINPFLAVEKPLYKEASAKGYCVKDKDSNDYYVKITTFPAAMVDLTNPEAWEWLKNIIKKNMIDLGLSGWMADFGEYLPTDCVLYSGEDAEAVHNTWPARWAKLNREAIEEAGKLGEIMFFTRAGYTDTKRYSTMMWNGDNHVDYSIDFGLPSVIPAALSLTCCGFGLSHSDIGGYTTFMNLKRSDELFMRWCEMNAFSPLMRSHEGLNPDANAQFDYSEEVLLHHAKFSRIHRSLKPYLKDCVACNSEKGVGVMRPLFFYYDEEKAYNEAYEYLLGRDILVSPVIKKDCLSKTVYLPEDKWVHLWSGKEYCGGNHKIDCPLGQPPVFIRRSSKYFDSLMADLTEDK